MFPIKKQPSELPLRQQMLEQCQAMAKHALASGMEVRGEVISMIQSCERAVATQPLDGDEDGEPIDLTALAAAHHQLAELVAPATPRALAIVHKEANNRRFGSAPLVRQLMGVALLFLAGLIALAATDYTSIPAGTKQAWSVYNSSGVELLARITYLICAAGLGACFAALFRLNGFIVTNTYDPKYSTSYWIRLLMGVISGILLCELIPLGQDASLQGITKPMLALLGGFSGNTVYRILERLVQSVEAVVRGDPREIADARIQAAASEAGQKSAASQVALAAKLAALRQQLESQKNLGDAKKQLDQLLAEMSGATVTPPKEKPD